MICSFIQGGLGNQLFQYAMGRAVATKMKRNLTLDARTYEINKIRRYQLPLFNIQAQEVRGLDERRIRFVLSDKARSIQPAIYAIAPWLKVEIVRDRESAYDSSVFQPRKRVLFIGFWQTEQYFAFMREQLLAELSFKESPSPENQKWLFEINQTNAVCLHVRRTDYIGNADLAQLGSEDGLRYYRTAIDRIRDCFPDATFYIFSDDPKWTRDNIDAGPHARFITHNVGTNDHEDLRLMMHCKHFIIANSTFSWWGAWLATHPAKQVIAPRVWLLGNEQFSSQIVPPGWVRL